MTVQYAPVPSGLKIAYETFGDPSNTPILLVMGLGTQMLAWDERFCRMLVDRSHFVVRFDNRDVGLSSHLDAAASGDGSGRGAFRPRRPAYRLRDMADDAAGLLAHLQLDSAHVVGISMGGFISQTLAIQRPDLVRSLTSISSSTGNRRVGWPRLDLVWRVLLRRPARTRDEAVKQSVAMFRRIGSPGFPFDAQRVRELAGVSYDRRYDPPGVARQLSAIMASPDRTAMLRQLGVPALVMHGLADPLVNVSGGRATAAAIPSARLLTFPGMGHDLPRPLWSRFVDEITDLVASAERSRARQG